MSAGPGRPAADGAVSLRRHTVAGMLWLGSQAVVSKTLAFAGQLLLAWLLVPEDFGVYAACLVALQFTNALRSGGVGPVLVQRHRRFDLWGPVAFQLSVVLGLISFTIVLLVTPGLLAALDEPVPAWLAWLVASEALLVALAIVPRAKLQSDMRFGALAVFAVGSGAALIASQVGLAWAGLGVLALLLPRPVISLIQLVWMVAVAKPQLLGKVRWRRWRLLLADSMWVLLALVSYEVTRQGDYVVLLLFAGAASMGLYYFAFNLATQTVTLVTTTLQSLLLPALSKLRGQDARQRAAVASASTRLALVALPVCVVQSVVAQPVFSVLFNEEFGAAWAIYAVLNLAMIFRLMNPLAANLIQAQGRFRAYFLAHASSAVVFLTAVTAGWSVGGLIGVAWGAVAHSVVAMILFYGAAFGFGAEAWRVVSRAVAAPLAGGAAGAAVGLAIMGVVPGESRGADFARCAVGIAGFSATYTAAVWWLDRTTIRSIVTELTGMLPGRRAPRTTTSLPETDL